MERIPGVSTKVESRHVSINLETLTVDEASFIQDVRNESFPKELIESLDKTGQLEKIKQDIQQAQDQGISPGFIIENDSNKIGYIQLGIRESTVRTGQRVIFVEDFAIREKDRKRGLELVRKTLHKLLKEGERIGMAIEAYAREKTTYRLLKFAQAKGTFEGLGWKVSEGEAINHNNPEENLHFIRLERADATD